MIAAHAVRGWGARYEQQSGFVVREVEEKCS